MLRALVRKLWGHERGAADPILTIAAIAVSGLVSASIVGAIILVINLGTDYMQEQAATTSFGQAQQAFTEDAQNSYDVAFIGKTAVTFYEDASNKSAVNSARGRGFACRVSEWKVSGLTLTNKVGYSNTATAVPCAGVSPDDASLFTVALQESATVPGTPAAAVFSSTNAAGAKLTFNNAGAFIAQTAPVPAYWTGIEWNSAIPQRITFTSRVSLPLAGERAMNLIGRMWYGAEHHVVSPRGVEGNPGIIPFNVGSPTGTTASRGTTGNVYGGQRESIKVSFGASTCGPYAVSHVVRWKPSTPGAPTLTKTYPSSYVPTFSLQLSPVPNGSKGTLSVQALCPPGIVQATSGGALTGKASKSFTQTLPTPVLTASSTGAPHIHNLSWTSVTSLAATYRVMEGPYFMMDTAVGANRTANVTQAITHAVGSTYGTLKTYRVTPKTVSMTGGTSAPAYVLTPAPPGPGGAVGVGSPDGTGYSVGASGCPAGTSIQYQGRHSWNGSLGGWSGWSHGNRVNATTGYGQTLTYQGEARCAAPFAVSGAKASGVRSWYNPPPVPEAPSASVRVFQFDGMSHSYGSTVNVWVHGTGKFAKVDWATSYKAEMKALIRSEKGTYRWVYGSTNSSRNSMKIYKKISRGDSVSRGNMRFKSVGVSGVSGWSSWS